MRVYFILILSVALAMLTSCNKKGNDSAPVVTGGVVNGVVNTAAGTYVVAGTVNVNASCGTTTATVAVNNGASGSTSVGTGSSFSFPTGAGTFTLTASAGTCNVSGQVPALTNGQTPYTICLSATAGVCQTGYAGGCTYNPYYRCKASYAESSASSASTIDNAFPGNGDFFIDTTQIYITPKKAGSFKISMTHSGGNDLLKSTPSLVDGAWSGDVATDGKITVGSESVSYLSYASQVDAGLMQFSSGFCGTATEATQKMIEYLQASGFASKAVSGFQSAWTARGMNEDICVYPQDSKTADNVATLQSESKMDTNRIWFAIAPYASKSANASKVVVPEKIAKMIPKTKVDALAALKKNSASRKIASDNDLLAQEWGFGFLIQK